jgi:hypothetical protein
MSQTWDKSPKPVHTLHTPYPLRRIAWRPNHETELVIVPQFQSQTSSDTSISSHPEVETKDDDAHLEIWDVRRHYIAKYAIPTSDGPAVDITWSSRDTLVTTFQNGGFAQIDLGDIEHMKLPLDSVPRQVMAWDGKGEMVYALDRFKSGEIPFDDLYVDTHSLMNARKGLMGPIELEVRGRRSEMWGTNLYRLLDLYSSERMEWSLSIWQRGIGLRGMFRRGYVSGTGM